MIKLALAVDADARAVRKRFEDEVEGVQTAQYAPDRQGRSSPTRATRSTPTPPSRSGSPSARSRATRSTARPFPPFTTIGGAFEHAKAHGNTAPYELPPSWFKAQGRSGRLRLDTPLNFVSTADIIGGNSGSPVVNRDNEVVGLIFDGNIQSLVLDFVYDDRVARAVSVDSRAIVEALRDDLPRRRTGQGADGYAMSNRPETPGAAPSEIRLTETRSLLE